MKKTTTLKDLFRLMEDGEEVKVTRFKNKSLETETIYEGEVKKCPLDLKSKIRWISPSYVTKIRVEN